MILQRITTGAVCVGAGIVLGMAGGLLLGADLPDVTVVGAALAVLIVWTGVAMAVGALIARHDEAGRFDEAIDTALRLRKYVERTHLKVALDHQRAEIEAKYAGGTDALIEATKEDR